MVGQGKTQMILDWAEENDVEVVEIDIDLEEELDDLDSWEEEDLAKYENVDVTSEVDEQTCPECGATMLFETGDESVGLCQEVYYCPICGNEIEAEFE